MIYLHVTFTLDAHEVARFKEFYEAELLPVIRSHGLEPLGIFETLVGAAGEITEIWRFENLADYERKWRSLAADPKLQSIFQVTGPMVRNEHFKLMEPVSFLPSP